MRKNCKINILFLLIILNVSSLYSQKRKVVGYCRLNRSVSQELDFSMITDIIGATVKPNSDGSLNTSSVNETEFQSIISKSKDNNVNVLIMIAGKECNAMASNSVSRANFITNITQFCLDYDINGVDMDWEQPNGFSSSDREKYTTLLKELDLSLNDHGLLLTMAGGTWSYEINKEAMQYLDWLNVMAYDMGKPEHATMDDAARALKWWTDFGFDISKLTLGLPFYGTNSSGTQKGYKAIVNDFSVNNPDEDMADGFYFNGVATIKKKVEMALDSNCLGVMIWELSLDEFNTSRSLIKAIDEVINDHTSIVNTGIKVNNVPVLNIVKNGIVINVSKCGNYNISVYNLKGRLIYSHKKDFVLGATFLPIMFSKGLNIISIKGMGNKIAKKVNLTTLNMK